MDQEGMLIGVEDRRDCLKAWRNFVREYNYPSTTKQGSRIIARFRQCSCWGDIFQELVSVGSIKTVSVDESEEIANIFVVYESFLADIFSGKKPQTHKVCD